MAPESRAMRIEMANIFQIFWAQNRAVMAGNIIIPKESNSTASEVLGGLFTAAQQDSRPDTMAVRQESVPQRINTDQRQQQKQETVQEARQEVKSQQAYEGKGMLKKLKHSLGIEE